MIYYIYIGTERLPKKIEMEDMIVNIGQRGYTLDEAQHIVAENTFMGWCEPNGNFAPDGQALYRVNRKLTCTETKYQNGYTLDEAQYIAAKDPDVYYELNGNFAPDGQALYRVNRVLS